MLLTEAELDKCAGVKPHGLTEAELAAEGVDVEAAKRCCRQRTAAARAACAALEAESHRAGVQLARLQQPLAVIRGDAECVLQSSGAAVVAAWEQVTERINSILGIRHGGSNYLRRRGSRGCGSWQQRQQYRRAHRTSSSAPLYPSPSAGRTNQRRNIRCGNRRRIHDPR